MEPHPKWRSRAHAALEAYFRDRSFPRIALTLIVTVAGVVGFLISHTLLHHGFEDMWLRYPIAVIGGYLTFLALLRFWVEIERARYDPKEIDLDLSTDLPDQPISAPRKKLTGDSGSWLDWLDVPEAVFELDEGCAIGCLIVFVIGLITGAAGLLLSTIMAAPELLAEVFLDAVVMSMFYRHLKTAAKEHWLGTAVKRTWRPALLTAAALSILGSGLSVMAPTSHTIGSALKEIFHKNPSGR